jgi:hypothetical protein
MVVARVQPAPLKSLGWSFFKGAKERPAVHLSQWEGAKPGGRTGPRRNF